MSVLLLMALFSHVTFHCTLFIPTHHMHSITSPHKNIHNEWISSSLIDFWHLYLSKWIKGILCMINTDLFYRWNHYKVLHDVARGEEVELWVTFRLTNLRPAPVRLTSPTSNGTVCSGFGARKVYERWQPTEEGKNSILCVCVDDIGISNESVQPRGSVKRFTTAIGGVFRALSVCTSASGAWAVFAGLAPVRAHEIDEFLSLKLARFGVIVHILCCICLLSILVLRSFSWHLTLRAVRVHVSCRSLSS